METKKTDFVPNAFLADRWGSDLTSCTSSKAEEDSESKKANVGRIANEFAENTSMHGMANAVNIHKRFNGLLWKNVFWFLLILCGIVMSIMNLVKIAEDFRSSPVTTEVKMEYQPKIEFPSVTICNMNKWRNSQFATFNLSIFVPPPRLSLVLSEMETSFGDFHLLLYVTEKCRKGVKSILLPSLLLIQANATKDEKELYYLLSAMRVPDSQKIQWGHQLSDMLLECTFDAVSIHFIVVLMVVLFYILVRESRHLLKTTSRPGPANGLTVVMDIQQDEYMDAVDTGGLRVVIGERDEMPFPEDEAVDVAPGFATSIALTKVEIRRQSPPYGPCLEMSKEKNRELNLYAATYRYTDNTCKKTCLQATTMTECKCCAAGYPCNPYGVEKVMNYTLPVGGNLTYCDLYNDNQTNCFLHVDARQTSGNLGCEHFCPPACFETKFKKTISFGSWPSLAVQKEYSGRLNYSRFQSAYSSVEEYQILRQNLLKLHVFYEQLNFEKIVTTPKYDWSILLSNIGGQLGLWLGFSLLTAFEVIELLLDMFLNGAFRMACCKSASARGKVASGGQ
ncbi:amiloride-sensitive sodium channel subunit gamma-like [Aplysia californica]|uniref:Amiloride-sensitive sodium channel subunit gamma-like n=1 Tax=Aplysia californica TaxID=6500 RepID=A0ABM1A6Q2_APLCA|nr:amiloride-sensitive sodium channel subunit gamma-like [Aplysia californica]